MEILTEDVIDGLKRPFFTDGADKEEVRAVCDVKGQIIV